MAEKTFVSGMIVKRNEKAPDFIICNLSFKSDEFIQFLTQHSKNGWVNIQVKRAKDGIRIYGELDLWEKDKKITTEKEDREYDKKSDEEAAKEEIETINYPTEEVNPEDIPF